MCVICSQNPVGHTTHPMVCPSLFIYTRDKIRFIDTPSYISAKVARECPTIIPRVAYIILNLLSKVPHRTAKLNLVYSQEKTLPLACSPSCVSCLRGTTLSVLHRRAHTVEIRTLCFLRSVFWEIYCGYMCAQQHDCKTHRCAAHAHKRSFNNI